MRKRYVPVLAVLLATLVAGCTTGTDGADPSTDAKAGETTGPAAPPGKYRTLYEPCGAVQHAMLLEMLPGIAEMPAEQQEKALRGTAAVTYDNDRRVGCSWKADSRDASHHLRIDVERVVSYDPAVSDEDRAQEVFSGKQSAAGLTAPPAPSTTNTTSGTTPSPGAPATASGPAPAGSPVTSGSPTPSGRPAAPSGLAPRALEGLGDAAFLNDVLDRAGSTAQHRTVSVVFRTSNAIVTVEYGEQPARTTEVPDSGELQEKAQALARKLAERFNE
ncbi:DUF3558 domain-containing protein [Streptomyces sp. NPDC059169]|uniref:DUF3558 domain-containing protein n=1 Tax=Streptomyces sp. NPDC059169 TaxID=3346754 RepID=UPI0036AE8D83